MGKCKTCGADDCLEMHNYRICQNCYTTRFVDVKDMIKFLQKLSWKDDKNGEDNKQ